jgi:hypothetical protein
MNMSNENIFFKFFKWFHIQINPELKEKYTNLPDKEKIYSTLDNIFNSFNLLDKGNKIITFFNKLVTWFGWFVSWLVQFAWFLMNNEYLFEIIFILLILYLITMLSRNIMPPIVYIASKLNMPLQRRQRNQIKNW